MFKVSQSLVKKFFFKGEPRPHCAKQIKECDIDKTVERPPTIDILKGIYFETMVIGGSAHDKGLEDLPRLKTGEKSASHKRIDEQVEAFTRLCFERQVSIYKGINTQVPIRVNLNSEFYLEGIMDVFPTTFLDKNKLRLAVVDIKMTGSLDTTFGEHCWGAVQHKDDIQDKAYNYLVRNFNIEDNPHLESLISEHVLDLCHTGNVSFYYWVFEHSPKKGTPLRQMVVEGVYNQQKQSELFESLRKTISYIEMYDKMGWPAQPDYDICKTCPLKETCPDVETIKRI